MGKFDGVLICSDLDNTLVTHTPDDHYKLFFCDEDVQAIRYFQREGGRFTVISGRNPATVRSLLQGFTANAPIGGFNGALIENEDGTLLYNGGCKDLKLLHLAQKLWEENPELYFVNLHVSDHGTLECSRSERGEQFFAEPKEMCAKLPFDTYNLVVGGETVGGVPLCELIPTYLDDTLTYTRPLYFVVEISRREDTKGAALLRIKQAVGARLAVAVGDYENDIEMLRAADIGYAVENACEALHAVADRTAPACGKGAIAAIVAELETRDL